jgi:hypothetical protein
MQTRDEIRTEGDELEDKLADLQAGLRDGARALRGPFTATQLRQFAASLEHAADGVGRCRNILRQRYAAWDAGRQPAASAADNDFSGPLTEDDIPF